MSSRKSPRWPVLKSLPGPDQFTPVQNLDTEPYPVAGIYFLVDEEGQIVYVGQTGNVKERIRQHTKQGTKRFADACYWECISASDRLAFEGILILASRPRYNRSVNIGIATEGRCYDLTRSTFARLGASSRRKSAKKKAAKPGSKERMAERAARRSTGS
jgi:excinuclease UvrABC nuclease subunit